MVIKIDNYAMNPGRFVAGTRGSYGIEQLDFLFSPEWDGLAVSVSFYPLAGDPVAVVYGGVPINIPAEVMNVSGTSRFVVSGYNGEKVLITAEGMVRVLDTSIPAENAALVPTPSQVSQIMTALGGKVDAVSGKGLSSNDYTDGEKVKLAGIEAGAEVNVQPDWNQTDAGATDYVKNKPVLDSEPVAGSGRGVTSGGGYSALAGKTGASHNHDSAYAAKIHEHSETYAPAVHNHGSSYAAINHDHDNRYAPAGHNHDSSYAASGHNHDVVYAPKYGLATGLVAGFAGNLSPVKHIEASDILLNRMTAAGECGCEIASAELMQIDGMSVVQIIENGNFADASGWEAGGGTLTVNGGVGSLQLDPPEAGGGSETDYTVEVGGTVSVGGYDTGLQTCEAGEAGIVSITEMANGEGWDIGGIAAGIVTLTVYEGGDAVASFTVGVTGQTSGEVVKKIDRAMSFISGHKYYMSSELKSPAKASGIVIFADDGGESEHNINSAADDDWQVVSGIITAGATNDGRIGIKDKREITAILSYTGPLGEVTIDTGTFSKYIGAFSPAASGIYRFVYSSGWKLNGVGQNLNISNYGITASFSTSDEGLRAGSVITVTFSYPFARGAAAALTMSGVNGITGLGVSASVFAGALGPDALSGNYEFKYITGTGWTFNGGSTAVSLALYGILGMAESQPDNNATITVSLTLTEEVIKLRKLTAYDLTEMGMEDFTAGELDKIVGTAYHEKGQTNALVGGIGSAGTAVNEFSSGIDFSGVNYELCRLPDGVADRLDAKNGKLYRRITYKTVTAQNGASVTLDGAKSGTAYISADGNVGSVSGTTLTLSKSVSSLKVYYELASPEVTDIDLPAAYRAATGGGETLKKYDSTTGTYVDAPLGVPALISYTPDCARQIEADRIKLQGLLAALGIITATDADVSAAAAEISDALAAFIAAQ